MSRKRTRDTTTLDMFAEAVAHQPLTPALTLDVLRDLGRCGHAAPLGCGTGCLGAGARSAGNALHLGGSRCAGADGGAGPQLLATGATGERPPTPCWAGRRKSSLRCRHCGRNCPCTATTGWWRCKPAPWCGWWAGMPTTVSPWCWPPATVRSPCCICAATGTMNAP